MTPRERRPFPLLVAAATVLVVALGPAALSAQRGGPPPVVSPDRADDGDVTFRLRAPDAERVQITSGGDFPSVPPGPGLDLTKGADGVWAVTLPELAAGAYRYRFMVDGVPTMDPSNPMVSQSNNNAWSLVAVPGSPFMDTRSVPHGALAEVHYPSSVLGHHRRMHVYTPPGYERSTDDYPVFYLLHGAGDSDDSWSTVGRAGFVLDNLIADGEAVPMVVVMPAGHTRRSNVGGGGLALEEFEREFAADIKPFVERHYRVRTDRASTAIAGLSMGGAHTLDISMEHLAQYGYVGVFSSGVFGIDQNNDWEERFRSTLTDASLRNGLELVWFSTGREDFLIDTTTATVELLRGHGFDVEYEQSGGGHTWINWREYLNTFTPRLFHD